MTDDRRNARGRQRGAARARGAQNVSQQAPAQRRRKGDPARNAAFDVLRQVSDSDAYANLALPPLLRDKEISGRDAAFATELVYGTLRMLGRYDAIIGHCVDRPLDAVDNAVLNVLRLGAHQVLGMRVPTHAAVSETVALTRDRVGAGPAQFVNAVLRKVSARSLDEWLDIIGADATDDLGKLAITQSHPAWIVRSLRESLVASGRDASEIGEVLEANNRPPRVTLVARPGLADPAEFDGAEPGRWAPTAAVLHGSDPGSLSAVRRGSAGVQDEGSQLVTLAFAATAVDGSDERWLDMCAGPGGKAALLGAIAAQQGARVVANESQEHRTELVRKSMQAVPRAAVEEIRTGDGREIGADEPGAYDRVLLDAPCTGLGALRRRPESRWRRTPADLGSLTNLQRDLLSSALDAVRPGGVVGYVTCSPHIAETQVVVDDVFRRRDDVELLDAAAAVRSVAGDEIPLTDRLDVQLWPHVHGTDAMHLSLLRKLG